MMVTILLLAVLLVTYSNGGNDNFKGVATLWGSGTLSYKQSLTLATIATFAGSVCSFFFAASLVKNFSGKGLVSDEITGSVNFAFAVALAAGLTVLLATKTGFPISTTHSLVGALIGAGMVASGNQVNFEKLGKVFFLPLILSPVLAIGISMLLWVFLSRQLVNSSRYLTLSHCVTAGMVSFARGLNDTPKLVSLLLVCNLFSLSVNFLLLSVTMAIGGLINAKKVAITMSNKITKLSHSQGFSANLVTGILVIVASFFGLPVSTTHVSVGSIYGIGLISGEANSKEIGKIGLSWLLTLPIAAIMAAVVFLLVHYFGG
jgi:PiT family inorganic phosphate transporter